MGHHFIQSDAWSKDPTLLIIKVVMRSLTTGLPVEGLAYGDVTYSAGESTGVVHVEAQPCVDMVAGVWSSGGFAESDTPGVYWFGVPKTILADGIEAFVVLEATGCWPAHETIHVGQAMATDEMVLAAAYDAAKSAAQAGDKMDLADSINATGVADLKTKLGTMPASGNWNTVAPLDATATAAAVDASATALIVATNLDAKVSTAGGGGLGGPNTRVIRFRDSGGLGVANVDGTVLAGSVVVGPFRADALGNATIGLSDGTYTISGRPTGGLVFTAIEVIVPAQAGPFTLSGAGPVLSTPSTGQTLCWLYMFDGAGKVAAGATLQYRLSATTGESGRSYDRETHETEAADATGLLQISLLASASYEFSRDGGRWVTVTTGAGGTTKLPEILGKKT